MPDNAQTGQCVYRMIIFHIFFPSSVPRGILLSVPVKLRGHANKLQTLDVYILIANLTVFFMEDCLTIDHTNEWHI